MLDRPYKATPNKHGKRYRHTKVKGVKGFRHLYRYLQGNPDQQRFTTRSGVLTGNDTRWCSVISGSPLPEWTDFAPCSLQLDRPTYAPASYTMAFTPQCSPAASITRYWLLLIYLPQRDGRLSWPRWLITYPDGLPASKQSPIRVVTRPSVN